MLIGLLFKIDLFKIISLGDINLRSSFIYCMKFNLLIFLFLPAILFSQITLTIPQIQGSGMSTTYAGQSVITTGIVTAKFIGTGKINGYFLQDETGDGNSATSDAIFVYSTTDNVNVGDKIKLTATASEYNGRTQLSTISSKELIASNKTIVTQKVTFSFNNFNWEQYESMLVEFNQTLYVSANANLQQYGQLSLSPVRKYSPTNQYYPSTTECINLTTQNSKAPILVDDGVTTAFASSLLLADANGNRRNGERTANLQAIVDDLSGSYVVYPTQKPVFYGNPRPTNISKLGNYNLKVCAFNVEYYLTTYGTGYGAADATQAARQHTKIIAALLAIDADIYGLIEIEQGQDALTKLVNALNAATVAGRYAFVNDGGLISGTYTKVGYIYRTDKVQTYQSLQNNNSVSPYNRKKAQAFTLLSNNHRFIFSLNHFKAKSGCSTAYGADVDAGDGQSCYNATRVSEANSTISNSVSWKSVYNDNDVLIMGDLNAYGKEDPIKTLVNAGYTDLHRAFHADSSYSYIYRGEAGYLDHALVSATLLPQVTGMHVFHINADEPEMFGYSGTAYQPDMYRCSDHDPVVVGLSLGSANLVNNPFGTDFELISNVTNDLLTINHASSCNFQLYSSTGQLIATKLITSNSFEINLRSLGLSNGIYLVKLANSKQFVTKRVLLK
jgi:predicted extracellular nuclease